MSEWDPFKTPERPIELFLTIYKTSQSLVKKLEEQLQPYDLTLGRLCLLVSLKRYSRPMLPSELSDDLAVTRANVSGLLNALEKTKLVRRDFDETNRRRVLVHLTSKGDQLLQQVWPIYVKTITGDIQSKLTNGEQMELLRMLRRLG